MDQRSMADYNQQPINKANMPEGNNVANIEKAQGESVYAWMFEDDRVKKQVRHETPEERKYNMFITVGIVMAVVAYGLQLPVCLCIGTLMREPSLIERIIQFIHVYGTIVGSGLAVYGIIQRIRYSGVLKR